MQKQTTLRILGIRGVPAQHGGFETFADHFAQFLVREGWRVVVYCQEEAIEENDKIWHDHWNGVQLVNIAVKNTGSWGSIVFDWISTRHAANAGDLVLTLGYNTALFCLWYRLKGVPNIINMDGIEWKRKKWSFLAKVWFYFNERMGCWFGNHLIADHPEIKAHLATRVDANKITMIPYGGNHVNIADVELIAGYGLQVGQYAILIARPEPENSLLEIVQAFSRCFRGIYLVVLGSLDKHNPYHAAVKAAASAEVKFVGAIYDQEIVEALRYYALFYAHGHQVGGTNPSLVESLGADNAILAHDNPFNRWVAGDAACYFKDVESCSAHITRLIGDADYCLNLQRAARIRHTEAFTWERICKQYLQLLKQHLPKK